MKMEKSVIFTLCILLVFGGLFSNSRKTNKRDLLITAFADYKDENGRIYLADLSKGNNPGDGKRRLWPVPVKKVAPAFQFTALAAGDFHGEDKTDSGYADDYVVFEHNNGDGKDELVASINGENHGIYSDDNIKLPLVTKKYTPSRDIIAMTSGDFDGDGDDELVFAEQFKDGAVIYASDDLNDLGKRIILTNKKTDISYITAMTAGDLDGDGRDELITAFSDRNKNFGHIYVADIHREESPMSRKLFSTDKGSYITAMTAGDFYKEGHDFLVFGIKNNQNHSSSIYLYKGNIEGNLKIYENSMKTKKYPTAMIAGDFEGLGYDKLVTAFSDQTMLNTTITYSDISKGQKLVGKVIYGPNKYWHVTAFAKGLFTSPIEINRPEINKPRQRENNLKGIDKKKISTSNFPNPFNPATTISLYLPQKGQTKLTVYNSKGQLVKTLIDKKMEAGSHDIVWDGTNDKNDEVGGGIYFYRIETEYQEIVTQKMIMSK